MLGDEVKSTTKENTAGVVADARDPTARAVREGGSEFKVILS